MKSDTTEMKASIKHDDWLFKQLKDTTLSIRGNPTIKTLSAILKATGLKIAVFSAVTTAHELINKHSLYLSIIYKALLMHNHMYLEKRLGRCCNSMIYINKTKLVQA